MIVGNNGNHPALGHFAQSQIKAGKQRAVAEYFAHAAEYGKHRSQTHSHCKTIEGCGQHRILAGKGFDTRKHDAVGDDQRNENAKHDVEAVHIGIHQILHHRDQHRDDQDVHRNADFIRHEIADRRDRCAAQCHHHRSGETQADGIHHRIAHCQQRAHAEQLHHAGVLFPQTVVQNIFSFLEFHYFSSFCAASLALTANSWSRLSSK